MDTKESIDRCSFLGKLREAAKFFLLVKGPLRGGEVKAGPLRKILFLILGKKNSEKNVTTKLEGRGLGAKWTDHYKKKLFCGFP